MQSPTELDNIFTGGGTIMAWIKFTAYGPSGFGHIIDKASGIPPTGGWNLVAEGDLGNNYMAFGHDSSGTTGFWNSGTGSLLINTEYHVALTYDKGSSANKPTFYINGISSIFTDAQSTGTMTSDASENFVVGNTNSQDGTFDGDIGDVRAYDHILTSAEIQTIFNARGHDGIVDGILGRWIFNEESPGTRAGLDTFYVDSTEASISSTFLSLSVPTHSTNDLLVAMVCAGGNASGVAPTITTPAGWTLITSVVLPATTSRPRVSLYRRVASSEPASYSFIMNQTTTITGIMSSYDGTEIGTTQDGFTTGTGISINPISPSITPSDNAVVLRICACDGRNLPIPTSAYFPANTIQRNALELDGVGNGCCIGYCEFLSPASATGTATFTGFQNDEYGTITVAFLGGTGDNTGDTAIDLTVNKNRGCPSGNTVYVADPLSFRRRT
jgi:hypothetical protein